MAEDASDKKVTYFAETDSRNRRIKFGIKPEDRERHMYVIGKTGMGKSTLLENTAIQDIENGEGLAFIDPHGGTAEKLLEYVPPERVDDVLYFAPFDMEYPISFNVIEDVGYDKRHLVVSGLMNAFEKIWADQWSSRMEYILSNTLLALLEYPDSTLLDVNRTLVDKDFRDKVIGHVTDPLVKAFWTEEFAKYTDRYTQEATPAIQNKIGQFTSNPVIRNIVGQPNSSFDMRRLMDEKKIFIANLSKGRMGETNADLLGSMLITKMYLAAMSRADLGEDEIKKLPPFYFYVDEFQSFANKSFADILSEARKYKLALTIAHQYIEQMSEEVRAAVFGNVGTMIAFRVGAYDAEILEKEFSPQFTAEDLVNLGFAQIYLKLMINGVSSRPFSATTLPPIPPPSEVYKNDVIEQSRRKFANSRKTVEEDVSSRRSGQKNEQEQGNAPSSNRRKVSKGNEAQHSKKDLSFKNENRSAGKQNDLESKNSSNPNGKKSQTDQKRSYLNKQAPPPEEEGCMSLEDLKKKAFENKKASSGHNREEKSKKVEAGEHIQELRNALSSILEGDENQSEQTDKGKDREKQSQNGEVEGEELNRNAGKENEPDKKDEVKKEAFEEKQKDFEGDDKGADEADSSLGEVPEKKLREILDLPDEDK